MLFARSVFVTSTGITLCLWIVGIFDIMSKIKDRIVSAKYILLLSVLKLPYLFSEIAHFVVLISYILLAGHLIKTSEAIIIFSSRVSIWRFMQPMIVFCILFGVFLNYVVQPIGAIGLKKYEMRMNYSTNKSEMALLKNGVLLFDHGVEGGMIISARTMNISTQTLNNVVVLVFQDNGKLLKRVDSQSAQFQSNDIVLEEARLTLPINNISSASVDHFHKTIRLRSNMTFDNVVNMLTIPEIVAFTNIQEFVSKLKSSGIDDSKFSSYYYKLFLRPFLIVAFLLIGVCSIDILSHRKVRANIFLKCVIFGFISHAIYIVGYHTLFNNGINIPTSHYVPIISIIFISSFALLNKYESSLTLNFSKNSTY